MRVFSLMKLLVVACLFVGSALLGLLTYERHSELIAQHGSLCENRAEIESNPRAGEEVYDWMYHRNVVVPTRWVYLSWTICVSLMGLSGAIMFGYDFRTLVRGASTQRNEEADLARLDLNSFIMNYSTNDQAQIAFASNGEVGSKLIDRNAELRRTIGKLVMESPTIASDQLIRDLYDAETKHSKASFGVYHKFVVMLAQELLTRGGNENLSCFLLCVMRAQDSYMSSQCVKLEKSIAESVVEYIDNQIAEIGNDSPSYYKRVRANIARQTGE